MRHEAIRLRFDQRRAVSSSRALDGVLGGGVNSEHIVPIHCHSGKAIALGASGNVLDRELFPSWDGDGILVVLDHKDYRELVHAREVHRLVAVSRARPAVARIHDGDLVEAAELRRERDAGAMREMGRHGRGTGHNP